ncbi:MAG: DUF393 domain-containing protein [Bacteroidia bacterium]|nr:DUF393 domain-containing protein [Bacteroidia bacterium]
MASANLPADKFLVVFDGVCHLCNGFVNFLISRDRKDRLLFATLQSAELLPVHDEIKKIISATDSIALVVDGKVFFRSAAVLRIMKRLGGGWALLYALIIIPKPLRDWVYDGIARNRYRLFGKRDVCMVPDEKGRKKFLG